MLIECEQLQAFDAPQFSDRMAFSCEAISDEVLGTTVTKAEMAEALGMRENDLFVERIFACMAKHDPNRVTFHEFLNTVIRFSRGKNLFLIQVHNHPIKNDSFFVIVLNR